jgi:hypothetical protein
MFSIAIILNQTSLTAIMFTKLFFFLQALFISPIVFQNRHIF